MENENLIKCLDQGFVRLIDVMGDDAAVVQSARVSYGKGTKSVRADKGLINYLLKHDHTSPFEMVEFKFHCKMPIFVARQWVRHRTASVNEISGRYSVMEDHFWVPAQEDLRKQHEINRQGSTDEHLTGEDAKNVIDGYVDDQRKIYDHYKSYLDQGIAREIARTNLPLSMYTEWYWKIDLHNLMHFLRLRLDRHAQKEIRIFAEAMAAFVKERCPLCYDAFEEHLLYASKFSRSELSVLRQLLESNNLTDELLNMRREQLKKDEASDGKINEELDALKRGLGV